MDAEAIRELTDDEIPVMEALGRQIAETTPEDDARAEQFRKTSHVPLEDLRQRLVPGLVLVQPVEGDGRGVCRAARRLDSSGRADS